MNLNPLIMELKSVTGYPVAQDIYKGKSEKYITFTYEDERANYHADDDEEEIDVNMMVSLYTPDGYDYFADKDKIKKALKERGFIVQGIQSWLEDATNGTKYVRHTVFTTIYTGYEE